MVDAALRVDVGLAIRMVARLVQILDEPKRVEGGGVEPARVRIVDTEKPESAVDREARAPGALSSHRIARDLHDARSDREVQKGHCVFESLTGGEGAVGRLRKRSIRRDTHFRRVAARTVRFYC